MIVGKKVCQLKSSEKFERAFILATNHVLYLTHLRMFICPRKHIGTNQEPDT
jgi:hypothetical protein